VFKCGGMRSGRVRPDLLEPEDFPVDFGRYRLVGLLGEGGMARVFRAELQGERGFRKPAAVKVIRRLAGDQDARLNRALIHEARLGGLLHHPNVVETYDFGEFENQAWVAMEVIEGRDLSELLAPELPLPVEVALEIGAQICSGLHHAHSLTVNNQPAPLVHRDLKPSNVIIGKSGLVKVLDFGIAKATHLGGNTTETGMTKGTPAYMSPEQAAGKEVDARSDLFAVGALLYELLTGQRFFQGDTVFSIMMNIIRVEELLVEPDRFDPVAAVCPDAAEIIRSCLRADRELRWGSARDLERAIRTIQGPSRPPGPIHAWLEALPASKPKVFAKPNLSDLRSGTEELELDASVTGPEIDLADPFSVPPGAEVGPTRKSPSAEVPSVADERAPTTGLGSGLPQTRILSSVEEPSIPDVGLTRPQKPVPVAPKPVGRTTSAPVAGPAPGETRLMTPAAARGRTALGIGGIVVGLLGVGLAVAVLMQDRTPPPPGATPIAAASPTSPGEPDDAVPPDDVDGGSAVTPDAEAARPDRPASTPRPRPAGASPSPAPSKPAPDATPAPAAPTPRATPRARPTPRPARTPAPAATAKLRHKPPQSALVGGSNTLSVRVRPSGACSPSVRYAPWDPADGGWATEAMRSVGGGEFELDLFLPYAVAWRNGFRYQIRCAAPDGSQLAATPRGGSHKIPALAR